MIDIRTGLSIFAGIIFVIGMVAGIVYMTSKMDAKLDKKREAYQAERQKKIDEKETYETLNEHNLIEIVTVRDCEYTLWHNGNGSDMEHYADCKNPNHE